jgi:hypothetical protein
MELRVSKKHLVNLIIKNQIDIWHMLFYNRYIDKGV